MCLRQYSIFKHLYWGCPQLTLILLSSPQVGVVDSPPRVFNSPYSSALSLDYNPGNRMSEFKVQNILLL